LTQEEFKSLYSAIERAASQQRINFADPSNTFTLWIETPTGSGEYLLCGKPNSLVQAMNLAGIRDAVICRTDIGRVQIIVSKNGQWFYS
jgi:hypothetical protein